MTAAERLLKEMETLEGKEKIDKWVTEYIEKEKNKIEKINILMSNTNYLEWLNQFTQDKESFCDDDWLYFSDLISETDRENVSKLCLFYEGIERFAKSNHIYPIQDKFGNVYKIKLNEIGYEIGILIGQGSVFSCKRCPIKNEKEFIDFNDIMNNKKQEQVDRINTCLETISKMVVATYESGVPIESIIYTLDNTIKEIIFQKDKLKEAALKLKKVHLNK